MSYEYTVEVELEMKDSMGSIFAEAIVEVNDDEEIVFRGLNYTPEVCEAIKTLIDDGELEGSVDYIKGVAASKHEDEVGFTNTRQEQLEEYWAKVF